MWKNNAEQDRPQMTTWLKRKYMPDTYGYKHTLTISNTYYFSTATMVARTRPNITLYVHCLSCYIMLRQKRCCNNKQNTKYQTFKELRIKSQD